MLIRDAADSTWQQYREIMLRGMPATERRAFEIWTTIADKSAFYRFQLQWLLEPAKLALCNKTRQGGFSHTTGAVGLLWGAYFGETTTIVSIGQRESQEVLEKVRKHAKVLTSAGSKWARIVNGNGNGTDTEIRFASGGRVIALPSSSGGRGYSGNIFLDEFAYLDHPDEVWDAAAPSTMHGYRMRVASTPNGVGNAFHRLVTDPKANKAFVYHEIPIDRAIADGMRVDRDYLWSLAKGDARLFDQMFRCKFLDGNLQYIPTAAVNECSSADCYTFAGDYYAGLDLGKENDLTALVVVRSTPDGMAVVQAIRTCKRTDTDALRDLVAESFQRYGWRRLAVDATGIGAFPAEQLQKAYGSHRVEAVTFSQGSKEDLATTAHAHFIAQGVRLPLTDDAIRDCDPGAAAALREDVCSIRRIVTSAGNVRYDAARTAEGHADRAWALFLALHAAKQTGATKYVK